LKEPLIIKGMHVGEQFIHSDEQMTFCRQMGVEYVDAVPPRKPSETENGYCQADILARFPKRSDSGGENYWTADALSRFREHVESFGLKLAAMHLSLQAGNLGSFGWPSILLGTPERDRDIEKVHQCIEAASKAGIPMILYSLNVTGTVRNAGWICGRGGTLYSYFDYDKLGEAPPHPAAPISAEQTWESIAYFIDRVIPVAEECKVKMACHPSDPAMPKGSKYQGIERVLGTLDDLKRFIDLHPSDYHGINFCQGCVSQSCTSPEDVYDAIRYFGSRKKIFWVHFRNIRGGFLKFEETFPDEGDIDMVKAMRTYKEVGYNGVLIPDHVPQLYLDTMWGHRAHAFAIGYIKALIQAVESEK
jgi:mannonate dehydratase